MFEEYTFEKIRNEMLASAPEGIDTREGSVFYDAVAANALKLAEMYTQMGVLYDQTHLKTALGEALDLKGDERLVERGTATQAEYEFIYEGEAPPAGTSFYSESGLYFTLMTDENGGYYLESVETGTECNTVSEGEKAIPTETHSDLRKASFGELIKPAVDAENDTEYRQSIYDSIVPGENGNIQHYKDWCKEIEGVDHARILPCEYGPNTVVGVIIASDGTAASAELLARVQEYIDPESKGLGEGAANLGAHFTAVAPNEITVDLEITGIRIATGYEKTYTKTEIQKAAAQYFKEITLETGENEIVLKASVVGAKIQELNCIDSYDNLMLKTNENGSVSSYRIELSKWDIPILGGVEGV